VATFFKPPNVYTGPPAPISTKFRQPDLVGRLIEMLGGLLVLAFAISFISGSTAKPPQQPAPPPQKQVPSDTTPLPSSINAHVRSAS
jgi:hypothetical protein